MQLFTGELNMIIKGEHRIVNEDVTDLAGVHVLRVDLRLRLLEVAAAERTVVVRDLHECQLGGGLIVARARGSDFRLAPCPALQRGARTDSDGQHDGDDS